MSPSQPDPPLPPRSEEIDTSHSSVSFGLDQSRTITPAAIGEYISFDQCPRYFKHRVEDHSSSWFHSGSAYVEAFRALNLLLSKAGHEFEQTVLEEVVTPACTVTDLDRDVDEFESDHEHLIDSIAEAANETAASDAPAIVSQASVVGTIGVWNVGGDIDLVFIWPTEEGATVRIIDIKRTAEEKSYHQIQAAAYVSLLRDALKDAPSIDSDSVTVEAGIITQEDADVDPTVDSIPQFDVEPRIMDLERLLGEDGELTTLEGTEFRDVSYQLDRKCANCPYNEACMTDAYEQGHLRLLGLTVAQQEILADHEIETVSDVANLCRPPDEGDWYPTVYRRERFAGETYRKLASTPGIGELLPTLVFRAQLLEDQIHSIRWPADDTDSPSSGTGVSDRPRPWIPGTGRCNLPDDEPDDDGPFATDWRNGSMIRIYLNVQWDHLRDRVILLSGRVTATASVAEPCRISVSSDGAPEVGDGADQDEEAIFTEFIEQLYDAIKHVASGIDYSGIPQSDPLVHVYLYDWAEHRALQEAFRRHDTELINSFEDLLEGDAGTDRPMVSLLGPIVNQHLQLPTPATGLLSAYEAVNPPREAYRKPQSGDEWSYDPGDASGPVSLQSVFWYRLFSRTVEGDPSPDGSGDVDPTAGAGGRGVPTRMRYDASIPLGYLWSATGRIDSEWVDAVRSEYDLKDYPLDTFRYRGHTDADHPLTQTDIEALGRHLCDAMEHVERSLTVTDATLEKEPYPLDSLDVDTFTPPSLAEASREYVRIEHTVSRDEEWKHYRKPQPQRALSGSTLPVQITDVDEKSDRTVLVTGRLRYDNLIPDRSFADAVKRACRVKGSEGSSSGSWMVASKWEPGRTDQAITDPYEIEQGVQATVKRLNLERDHVEFTLTNFWGGGTEFGRSHRLWTTDTEKAEASDRHVLVEPTEHLLLDPQTDDINARRIDTALEYGQENALHELLENVRFGRAPAPTTDLFSRDHLSGFADFMEAEIGEETIPSEEQRDFITEHEAHLVALQGPPGTGKTKGAFAPALIARAWDRSIDDAPFAGLVTAPSNTAIDELLTGAANLFSDCEPFDSSGLLDSIEFVRIASDKPDDPPDPVTYVDYNDSADAGKFVRLKDQLRQATQSDQETLAEFSDDKDSAATQTLVFATPSRAWKLIDELTPGDDSERTASQSIWHLLAVDEASMMPVPQLLLAGAALRSDGQVLVGGDHRQLPPVQKHDWSEERRRSIQTSVPYLSALDYLRILNGWEDDVLEAEAAEQCNRERDVSEVDLPFVQLSTTYRFGHTTAALAHDTVYEQDEITFTANGASNPLPARSDVGDGVRSVLTADSPIALITYNAAQTYQQSNEIEEAIAAAVINARPSGTDAGVVTPHNAQKSRLQATIYDSSTSRTTREDVQIETVNRFQGGEADLMVLSGTVADPQYIRAEADFLLTETRVNVAMTRHKRTLVVIAPQSLLGYIPADPELYEHATIWKTIAAWAGEDPTNSSVAAWEGDLQSLLVDTSHLDTLPDVEYETMVSIYHVPPVESG